MDEVTQIRRFAGIALDITQRKLVEQEVQVALVKEKELSQLRSIAKGRRQRAEGRRKKIDPSRFQYFALS